jgi:hypothetical protein
MKKNWTLPGENCKKKSEDPETQLALGCLIWQSISHLSALPLEEVGHTRLITYMRISRNIAKRT